MPSPLDIVPIEEPLLDPETGLLAEIWRPWFSLLDSLMRGLTERWTTANRPTKDLFIGRRGFNITLGSMEIWDGSAWTYPGGLWNEEEDAFVFDKKISISSGINAATWPRFSVHKGGAVQTNVGTAFEIITWATALFDEGAGFDFTNNKFTVPTGAAGIYLFHASIFYNIVATSDIISVEIRHEGTSRGRMGSPVSSTNATVQGRAVTKFLKVADGDDIEIFSANVTNVDTVNGTPILTFFEGCRVA